MLLRFTKLWDEINPFSEEIVGQTGYVRGGPRISSCEYAACACLRARHCPDTCMPARTALPRHTCAYTHAAQCARPLRNKRSQLLIDACAQLANPQVARRDPARTCGRQSVGRNGPVRGLLRPRRYARTHRTCAHSCRDSSCCDCSADGTKRMRAHDAVVATTLHSWPLAHAPMHGTRCKSLEPLCGACRSDEPRDVHNRRADRFHECAIRRRRL